MNTRSCCMPVISRPSNADGSHLQRLARQGNHELGNVGLSGGTFLMGDSSGDGNPADGELPVHAVHLDGFRIDNTSVTNEAFSVFVDETGYITDAERFGFSAVFYLSLAAPKSDIMGFTDETPWWASVRYADWTCPGGQNSSIEKLSNHPVVHVSWNDAVAYCKWANRRLPTEAEWEYASRGGIEKARYPWGDLLIRDGWRCNIWQGRFPTDNTQEDGWLSSAPVRAYEPNGYGLWQTVGNVWEWCSDWFDVDYYSTSPKRNPGGPPAGASKVLRGGSFLCHNSYCNRYRNSARSSNTPDSSMSNAGFRTVALV